MNETETIGILLPTKGRYIPLRVCLDSLVRTENAGNLEVIIVCDSDKTSFDLARSFYGQPIFKEYKVIFVKDRMYSVSAFNKALENCSSRVFLWTADKVTYDKDAITNIYKRFIKTFSDRIGVLAAGGKFVRANFGMTSKDFIGINGDWFWNGYVMNYCDDELSCRAVLLGRYHYMKKSGLHIEDAVVEKFLLYDSVEEKIKFKKIDRGKFYKRTENFFGLDPKRVYEWEGFRNVNLPLKGLSR